MRLLLVALAFLLGFCAFSVAEHLFLQSYPSPIILGQPFKLIGIIEGTYVTAQKIDLTKVSCQFSGDETSDVIFLQNHDHLGGSYTMSTEAIILGCPGSLQLSATFTCTLPPSTQRDDPQIRISRQFRVVPGWAFEPPKLELESSDGKLFATFSLTNQKTVAELGVFCTYTFDDAKWQPEASQCTSCKLEDFLGSDTRSLDLSWPIPADKTGGNLTVTCSTDVGFERICKVAEISKVFTLPPPASVSIQSGGEAIAGLDYAFTFSVKGIPQAENCVVTFPPIFHPTENQEVKGCSLDMTKGQYICTKVFEGKNIEIPFHVNPNENIGNNDITVQCANINGAAVPHHVEIKRQSTFNVALSTNRKQDTIGVTATITNKGPSDAFNYVCEVKYPSTVDITLPAKYLKACTANDDFYSCKMGNLTASDGKQVAVIEAKIEVEGAFANVTRFVTVCCENTYCNSVNISLTQTGNDNKQPTNTDGSFWTYAIVVVNLFMIALVVFIGIWWRNRAISKSLENAPRDRELDLFEAGRGSAGERFIPKAE